MFNPARGGGGGTSREKAKGWGRGGGGGGGGGVDFPVVGKWVCATGWGCIFTTGY